MIFGSGSTELPFEVRQCAVLPIHLFDFEFSKTLRDRSVFHDRHVVERDICDGGMVRAYADSRTPDSQGCHRHEWPLSDMKKKQIAEDCWGSRLAIDQLNFLPVLHEREFQLPGLFPALNSMAKGDPSMGQVVLGGVIVGRGQQTSWKRGAGKMGQTEVVTDRQFDLTLYR
jgi:hypothetical protein